MIEENINYSEDITSPKQSDDVNVDNSEFSLRNRKGKIITCAKETIENASRMIRRRVPCSGHLMTPRRLWLNKIPTQCDVVIEFPKDAPQKALLWLLERLRGILTLDVLVKEHESTKRTAFYITAPINVLIRAAEEARLPKRLRDDLGGALKEFTTRESHCFAQIKDTDGGSSLFTSQERQWLVAQVLQGLRAGAKDLETLDDMAKVEEGQSIVAAWQESGLIVQIFPLHENHALSQLQSSWVRKLFAAQPLDDIAEYFGVKVALYFAWLGHYTSALCVPAILGTILWAVLLGRGQTTQDIGNVLFSLFNVAWASLYLEAWRRYSVEISFRWGTLSTPPELLEPPRPLYKGRLEANLLNGRLEPKEAPAWKRRAFRYFVSFPIIGLCLILVFVVMFLMLQFQDWWDEKLPEGGILSYLSVFPKVLLALLITFMDEAYFKLAVYLNDKENYRLQSKYENHLIGKVALFQFVNSFLSLFYIAFYLRDQEKLKEQLAGLLISRQLIGNIRESIFPYFVEQLKLANLSFTLWGALSPTQESSKADITKKDTDAKDTTTSTPTSRSIGQAEIESSLSKYDGTFADHLEMLVQMGYVVLFSAAFPLAGLCALANNLLEIRSDAFKLAHVHQRGFGQRVANIGTWQNALSLLGLAAVIVNCALIGLSGQVSRLWPGLTSTQTVVLIVALEHTMLAVRSILTWLLPELPSWLAAEIARAEHCRREMQCRGVTPRTTSPPSPPSTTSHLHDSDIYSAKPADQNKQIFGRFQVQTSNNTELSQHESRKNSTQDDYPDMKSSSGYEGSNESPISEASTLILRPFADASPDELNSSGACYKAMVAKNLYIPQFRGHIQNKPDKGEIPNNSSQQNSNKIPEIPPFKKQTNRNVSKLVIPNASESPSPPPTHPPRMEIPPYKPRKSKDWPLATEAEHHLTIGPSGGAEWARRLKAADPSSIHRSTDCIAKELTTSSDSELLKPAPSWNTVAFSQKPETASGSSSVPSVPVAQTEEEIKAAELAAKKSRIKQSLVKRARSVAIFSLKLKERRAREAERIAQEENRMNTPFTSFGGELSVIPIEKLIQVEDVVVKGRNNQNNNNNNNSNSPGTL